MSKLRLVELDLLFDENEAILVGQLVKKAHKYRTSGAIYEGQWFGGFRHGQGMMRFRDGSIYEGSWYLGRAHGHGKFTQIKGETYEGDWANDMQHGKGLSSHVNNFQYEGQFKKGI